MAPAPWESLPARETLFVLVTGANSGIGLGICERLIDTFLTTHSLTSHLVLLPTTRSARKSAETVASLRAHLARAASSPALLARGNGAGAGPPTTTPQDTIARVHISSVQLDLCDLTTVRRAADQLIGGTVAFDDGKGADEQHWKIPRLDAVIFNAGIGGWTHVSFPAFFWDILTRGYIQATTRPLSKRSKPGLTVAPVPGCSETLGMVFCANVFGHYMFAHYLVPLLSRRGGATGGKVEGGGGGDDDVVPPGRVIWQSSVDPSHWHLKPEDMQCLRSTSAYESSKMLTDTLCLTSGLPSVRPWSTPYLDEDDAPPPPPAPVRRPNIYLAHPGIVATTIMPLHFALMWAYVLGTTISRWLGSPWHPVAPYKAATATVWLALAAQAELDAEGAGRCKWGSATDFWGTDMVKRTEVDLWGWDGRAVTADEVRREDSALARAMRRSTGRRIGAEYPTDESMAQFEERGARCWAEMERLRREWEPRVEKAG